MEIAISFALALFLSTVLVPVAMRYADALGLVDQPDARKIHENPIPRCGGLAIAIAVFIPTLFWLHNVTELTGFFLGALIIAIFGFLDDRHDLDYKWKFFGQIIGVAVFIFGNVDISKTPFMGLGDLMPWVSYPVIALFILGVTNAVNLSDGLDGLAAGSGLLSLGFIAYLAYVAGESSLTLIAIATMGGLMGFLRFNTHPASVFMGDAGSQFLGYVTACLAIMVTQSTSSAVSPVLAIVIIGLPILDTLTVMLLRMRDGNSPFHPDKRHIHHQFLSLGMAHYQSVAALYILNFILLLIAYVVRFESDIVVLLSYMLFCTATLGLIGFFKHSAFAKRIREQRSQRVERRNLLLRKLGWIYSYGALAIQYLLGAIWLIWVLRSGHSDFWLGMLSIAVLLLAAFLWRQYQWQRTSLRILLYSASVCSVFMAIQVADVSQLTWGDDQLLANIMMGALVVLLILSIRMTRRELFRLDTQDILVLLILSAATLLAVSVNNGAEIIGAVIRLAILLYAAEYIIDRAKGIKVAAVLASLTLVLTAVRLIV